MSIRFEVHMGLIQGVDGVRCRGAWRVEVRVWVYWAIVET